MRVPSTSAVTTPASRSTLRWWLPVDLATGIAISWHAIGASASVEEPHDLQPDGIGEGLEHLDEVELARPTDPRVHHVVHHADPVDARR